VGQRLIEQSATHVTKLGLELGGHAPFIVFDDADVGAAVEGALASKFRNAGQTCVCPNRFYVHERVYDDFIAGLKNALSKMVVGNGLDEGVTLGPIIDDDGIGKIERHVEDARNKGGRITHGGNRVRIEGLADRFFAPTLIEDFTDDMELSCEETFGPVVPVRRFSDDDAVVEWANASAFGLASYLFTRDLGRAFRVAEALEYGIVGVNDGRPSTPQAPFGGFKASGLGREGGKYGLEEFLETKYISLGLGSLL
jgi:succinate-semialdehyde dehydrogenase/glutarate-semialdehyde dehydrogenase